MFKKVTRVIWKIFKWPTILVGVLAATFVIDALTRRGLNETVTITQRQLNASDPSNLVVVFPGAFSEADYQFEPVAAELADVDATVLYVEQSGDIYDTDLVDKKAFEVVGRYLDENTVEHLTLIGTSMGAGQAWQLAQSLYGNALIIDSIETTFIAIDGVGSPDDLAGPGPFGAKYLSRLPFGWIWNHIPVARVMIQPSDTSPLPQWKEHAEDGLEMARSIDTASWAGQLRAMGKADVTPDSLNWLDQVVYIRSLRDTGVVKGDASSERFRAAAGDSKFSVYEVDANHTDYEAAPADYARIIGLLIKN